MIKSIAVVVAALFLSQQQQQTQAAFTSVGTRVDPSGVLDVNNAFFGSDVAVSGDGTTLIVGARGYDGLSGACSIYIRQGSDWVIQEDLLVGSDVDENANFGSTVAISENGRVAAVGAPGFGANGAVWVFRRNNNGVWSEDIRLEEDTSVNATIPAAPAFGVNIELSNDGDTLAVGTDDGVVVYFYVAGEWTIQTNLITNEKRLRSVLPDDSTPSVAYTQGQMMAMSKNGDYIAIASSNYVHNSSDEEAAPTLGAVWTWARSNGLWEETALLTTSSVPEGSNLTQFGVSLALSENGVLLVVRATEGTTPKIVEFSLNEATLGYDGGLLTQPTSTHKLSVGNTLAIARSGQLYFAGDYLEKKVFVFADGGAQVQEIDAPDATPSFGFVVSSSNDGRIVVVSSPNPPNKGAVWTFQGPGTSAPTSSPTVFKDGGPNGGPPSGSSDASTSAWLSYAVAAILGMASAMATLA